MDTGLQKRSASDTGGVYADTGEVRAAGCPDITDIECMCSLLESTGASVAADFGMETGAGMVEVDTRSVREHRLPENMSLPCARPLS